jgi:hypothetical protein
MNIGTPYKQTTQDKLSNFLFNFTGLKDLGEPLSILGIISNDTLYNLYPDRYNFYTQVMESITNKNPSVVKAVIRSENSNRVQREIMNKKLKTIYNYFSMAESTKDNQLSGKTVMEKLRGQLGRNILTQDVIVQGYNDKYKNALKDEFNIANIDYSKIVKDLKKKLKTEQEYLTKSENELQDFKELPQNNPDKTRKVKAAQERVDMVQTTVDRLRKELEEKESEYKPKQSGGELGIADLKHYLFAKQLPNEKECPADTNMGEVVDKNPQYSLKNLFKNLGNNGDTLDSVREKEIVRSKYMNHEFYSPNNEKVDWADKGIFVSITYIIRAISLFLTEWAIFTGYVTTFTGGFSFYFGMYACIYILLLFVVNSYKDDMTFRLLFFYINTASEDGKGYLRVLLHFFALFALLPIPYLVKEYRTFSAPTVLNFEDKSKILNSIETFSLAVWGLTSLIVFIV